MPPGATLARRERLRGAVLGDREHRLIGGGRHRRTQHRREGKRRSLVASAMAHGATRRYAPPCVPSKTFPKAPERHDPQAGARDPRRGADRRVTACRNSSRIPASILARTADLAFAKRRLLGQQPASDSGRLANRRRTGRWSRRCRRGSPGRHSRPVTACSYARPVGPAGVAERTVAGEQEAVEIEPVQLAWQGRSRKELVGDRVRASIVRAHSHAD